VHVGLIGSGNITDTHARAARAAGLTIAAVCGRTLPAARRVCETHGGTPYDALDAFLAHRPLDLVAIGTPSGLHAAQGIEAARRGLHVLVEKPIDVTTERADALIAEAGRAGVRLAVCFQDRFAPDLVRAKDLIDGGGLGRLLIVDARVPWYRPPSYYETSTWRGTWQLDGGGALMNQGSHTVDLLLWLCGDIVRVHAVTAALRHRIEVEDTALALLEFAGGARGTLVATTAAYPGFARRVMVAGTDGTLTIDRDALVGAAFAAGGPDVEVRAPAPDDGRSSTPAISDVSGHRKLFEDFVHAIRTGSRPRCDGRDGRRSVAVIRAIYESAAAGRPIDVS
jgi:predicted dehydrogenase